MLHFLTYPSSMEEDWCILPELWLMVTLKYIISDASDQTLNTD